MTYDLATVMPQPKPPRRRATTVAVATALAVGLLAGGGIAWVLTRQGDPAAHASMPPAATAGATTSAAAYVDPDASEACHQLSTAEQFGTNTDPVVMATVGHIASNSTDDNWRIAGHLLEDRAVLAKAEIAAGRTKTGQTWLEEAVTSFEDACLSAGLSR